VMYSRHMQRTNIYLTERQMKLLAKEAEKVGVSMAELVRRILDAWLAKGKA
jgi:hypothetical protein